MSRLRVVFALVVAAVGGAGLFAGQVALAGWIGFMRPYEVWALHSSDESVYFHEFLAAWFAVTGIVLAALLARVVAGSPLPAGWHVALALAAGAGAGASVPWVTGFLRVAHPAGASPYTGDIRANLVWLATAGTVLGTLAAAALLRPALRRGMTIWIAWTWLVFGYQVILDEARYPRSFPPYSLEPLGILQIPVSYRSEAAEWGSLAVTLLPIAALAWWSARRRERWPAAGALTGPVVIAAAYLLGLQRLPATGDHYGLLEDFGPWIVITLAGTGVAALCAYLGRRHRSTDPGARGHRGTDPPGGATSAPTRAAPQG